MIEIYMNGMLEPIIAREPMDATAMNMSAAMNSNMRFFMAKDEEGKRLMVSIPAVIYMRDLEEDDD